MIYSFAEKHIILLHHKITLAAVKLTIAKKQALVQHSVH